MALMVCVGVSARDAAAQVAPADTAEARAGESSEASADSVFTLPPRDPRALMLLQQRQRAKLSKPRWVMLRSLVVPGWGQAYNHAWLKAGLIFVGESALIYKVVDDERNLRRLNDEVERARASGDLTGEQTAVNAYNDLVNPASTRQYMLGLLVVYALMDAYVDAQFRHFKVDFQEDPALQGGGSGGVRLRWEWEF